VSKPSKLPRWATNAFAVSEPDELKKGMGYAAGEKPAPRLMNWLFNTIYGWCAYLSGLHTEPEFLGQLYTWTNTHVFQLGAVVSQLLAGGHVFLAPAAHVIYSDTVGAPQPRLTIKHIPLQLVEATAGAVDRWRVDDSEGLAVCENGAGQCAVYLNLPTGAVLKSIAIGVTDVASFAVNAKLVREELPTLSYAGGAITKETIVTESSSGAGAWQVLCDGTTLTHTINNAVNRYRVHINANAAGAKLHYIAVTFQDVGFTGNG
jgi:hypothetical protein